MFEKEFPGLTITDEVDTAPNHFWEEKSRQHFPEEHLKAYNIFNEPDFWQHFFAKTYQYYYKNLTPLQTQLFTLVRENKTADITTFIEKNAENMTPLKILVTRDHGYYDLMSLFSYYENQTMKDYFFEKLKRNCLDSTGNLNVDLAPLFVPTHALLDWAIITNQPLENLLGEHLLAPSRIDHYESLSMKYNSVQGIAYLKSRHASKVDLDDILIKAIHTGYLKLTRYLIEDVGVQLDTKKHMWFEPHPNTMDYFLNLVKTPDESLLRCAIYWHSNEKAISILEGFQLSLPALEKFFLVAVQRNNLFMVKYFLDHTVLGTEKDENQNTPLHIAVNKTQSQMIRLLLTHDNNQKAWRALDEKNYHHHSPLGEALRAFNSVSVEALCQNAPQCIHLRTGHNNTKPLLLALSRKPSNEMQEEQYYKQIELLLQHGAAPNEPSPSNDAFGPYLTPLGLALKKGDVRLLKLLLAHKASPEDWMQPLLTNLVTDYQHLLLENGQGELLIDQAMADQAHIKLPLEGKSMLLSETIVAFQASLAKTEVSSPLNTLRPAVRWLRSMLSLEDIEPHKKYIEVLKRNTITAKLYQHTIRIVNIRHLGFLRELSTIRL